MFSWVVLLLGVLGVHDSRAGEPIDYLYPDLFPYVEPGATGAFETLQNWQLSGTTLSYSTLFANQGDGLFEIRRGQDLNAERHELLQRVYINNDNGPEFEDISIGSAPIPGTAGTPRPGDLNVIWFEDFSKFSLHEAPVVDGLLTVGDEVAGDTKTSWRLSPNTGPLPGYSTPGLGSSDQTVSQRIGVGWADLYGAGSMGQSFDISGVPIGPLYWLRQTVDPADRIMETDETNNSFEVLIDLANPGEAIMFAGDFVQPGDAAPADPGDLNFDGVIDLNDWLAFKAGANVDLDGLDPSDAYALGDLNNDGEHSLSDVILFRQYYDAANGEGAFATIQATPEPASLAMLGVGGVAALLIGRRVRRHGRGILVSLAVVAIALAPINREAMAVQLLFSEDFEGLPLGPNVNESLNNPNAWTDTPPAGWTVDDSGVPSVGIPNRGVTEWEGWSFADKNWWVQTAGDQNRSQFDLGQGTVAVADPDEWDDLNSPSSLGAYNAFLTTPAIPLGSAAPDTVQVTFASSWREEDTQAARLRASFDGGQSYTNLLLWDSNPGSAFFKDDAPNEQVTLSLNNPQGASDVILEFGMLNAANDWWWAIDNLQLFTPSTLLVNTITGEMMIDGAADMTGYEIVSENGSLDPAGWAEGNLDSRNYGSPTPTNADFSNDGDVNLLDLDILGSNFGQSPATSADGDANGDGVVDLLDLDILGGQFGSSVGAGDSWETLIASDDQLLEFYLGGASSFSSETIGNGYNTSMDARDLDFFYSTSDGSDFVGSVVYLTGARSIPEPSTMVCLLGLLVFGAAARRI